jgi:hypothetical protein
LEAEIVTEVGTRTTEVFTVKAALVAPAGTATLEGTVAEARAGNTIQALRKVATRTVASARRTEPNDPWWRRLTLS